jgi:hypothetical protein
VCAGSGEWPSGAGARGDEGTAPEPLEGITGVSAGVAVRRDTGVGEGPDTGGAEPPPACPRLGVGWRCEGEWWW